VRDHGIENDEDGRAPSLPVGAVHVAGYAVRSLAFARVTGDPRNRPARHRLPRTKPARRFTGVPSSVGDVHRDLVVDPAVPFSCLSPVLLTMRTAVPLYRSTGWPSCSRSRAGWRDPRPSTPAGEIMV